MSDSDVDADFADTLAYASENLSEFSQDEICVLLSQAAEMIDELRGQLERRRKDGKDGHRDGYDGHDNNGRARS